MTNNKTRKNNDYMVYSKDDYNSNDGMLTSVWGPALWHYMHTMSFNYPIKPTSNDKKHYKEFILNLKNVLPCGKCRKNLIKNFKKLPLTNKEMESRDTFSKYIYDLHEIINTMLGKKSNLTYDQVRERYEHFRARCAKSITSFKSFKSFKSLKNKTAKKVRFSKNVSIMNEKGCTVPLYGEKSKCIIKIVPHDVKCDTLQIDERCVKKHLPM